MILLIFLDFLYNIFNHEALNSKGVFHAKLALLFTKCTQNLETDGFQVNGYFSLNIKHIIISQLKMFIYL